MMRTGLLAALLLLNLAQGFSKPQNAAEVSDKLDETKAVAGKIQKGDSGILDGYQNDAQYIRACLRGECRLMTVGVARGHDLAAIESVQPVKGDQKIAESLTPTLGMMTDQLKGLQAQKALLENLEKEMAEMNSAFSKGQQLSEMTKGQFAETISNGVSFSAPAAGPAKGVVYAAPPVKGFQFAAAPSKGGSAAMTNVQLEAALCPMTMYELGKSQKLQAETKAQLDAANNMIAMLTADKNRYSTALASSEILRQKAQEQANFNAKFAAEQKNQAEALAAALARANADKAVLQRQKADLESGLAATQAELGKEKENVRQLTDALKSCNDDKDALQKVLTNTQIELRNTQRALANEKDAHAKTMRQLRSTQEELEATETARQKLEEAKQQLEDELAETKNQLQTVTDERDQLKVSLDSTSAELEKSNEENLKCQSDLAQEKAVTAQLSKQLQDAMVMLEAEKKAREELAATIEMVKRASEKVQEEVRKLQLENVQLQQLVQKLRAEQENALALASGCPPTYEKFGISCYKYVREKTQWKMAQEQCMKDSANLVSIESSQEQVFLVDYLRRHGASTSDAYVHTSGNKQLMSWKWLGSNQQYVGQLGTQYWFNEITKSKSGYDCMALYVNDASQYGKWVALPCYNPASYVCEYNLIPPGTNGPTSMAEQMAIAEMSLEAPAYLKAPTAFGTKGSYLALAANTKGNLQAAPAAVNPLMLAMATKG